VLGREKTKTKRKQYSTCEFHKFLELEAAEDCMEEVVDAEGPGITTGVTELLMVPVRDPVEGS
jgi:hypothetical protein